MRDERGLSNSVSTALLLPVFLTVLFLGMQWAMLAWATAMAQSAAQEGARAAAHYGSTLLDGESAARGIVNERALLNSYVHSSRDATTVTVGVTGDAVRLVPGFPLRVEVAATVPRERLTQR